MDTVRSKDGTTIAFDKTGRGPALLLVDGALCYRAFGPSGPLAKQLANDYTVFTYDRRGRGDSSDAANYSVEREIDDIEALIGEAGGSVFLFGISSGAVLALDAANRLSGINKLAVYEAPFVVDPSGNVMPEDFLPRLKELVAAGRRTPAVKLFMRQVGVPAVVTTVMPLLPMWRKLKGVAHTLPNDITVLGDTVSGKPLPTARWESTAVPVLVMHGGKSPAWMGLGARALAGVLPDARLRTLEGQTHMVKPHVLALALREFFTGREAPNAPATVTG